MSNRSLAVMALLSLSCSAKVSTTGGAGGAGGTVGRGTGGQTSGSGGTNGGSGGRAAGSGGTAGVTPGSGGSAAGSGGTAGVAPGSGGRAAGSGGTAGVAPGSGGRAAGSGGTAGVAPGSGGAGGSVSTGSVLERANHPSRDGHYIQPTLTKAAAARMAKDANFTGTFNGNTWASPLYMENGPGGRGAFFVVTNGNDVYAIDEAGAMIWTHSIGTPAARTGQTCGDINPLGIISTPVIDAPSRTIFVAGAIGNATTITAHQVHALSVDDGSERTGGWPVDVSTLRSGNLAFTASPQNQRSALSLVGGILYVAYGGHNGDCGTYHGWVIAINTANPAMTGAWATGSARGEAIWAAGGMASDGNGVFAVTGNAIPAPATHVDSEEVVRVTGLATVTRTNQNIFYPTTWMNMDTTDADFGSSSPVYIDAPSPMVAAVTKDGHLFLLDSRNLGGVGGQLADLLVASGAGMIIHTSLAAYKTAMGTHVALTTNNNGQCPAGGATGRVVMSVLVPAGTPVRPQVAWCTAIAPAGATAFPASPMITTTDGTSDAVVWFISGTRLVGVDGDTGAIIYGGGTDTCTGIRKWTAPIAVKGRIVVAGDGHLCSWSPH